MTHETRYSGTMVERTARAGWSVDPQDSESSRYGPINNRASGKHIRSTAIEGTNARQSWQRSRYGLNGQNPIALSLSRDRAATAARPIVRPLEISAVERQYRERERDQRGAERQTLLIPPSPRQWIILPRVKQRPSSRINIARTILVSLVLYYVLSSSLQLAGHSGLPLAPFPWVTPGGAASAVAAVYPLRMDGKVAARVRPMTQMRRVDLYDSRAQFNQWGGAACSAATLAEILTAYGLPHMTIGRMIREFGKDISPNWGLLTYNAFNKVVAKYGLRADVYLSNNPLTYKQMLYLTNTLGIPVVVNMRATTGYYHYLSGGHILVMTGGNSKTIRLVDSSLYYMKSLPLSTYNRMARPRNVVIVPKDFHYTLPR